MDTWWSGKNEPNQSQSKPIKANIMPKQTQFYRGVASREAGTNPTCRGVAYREAGSNPISKIFLPPFVVVFSCPFYPNHASCQPTSIYSPKINTPERRKEKTAISPKFLKFKKFHFSIMLIWERNFVLINKLFRNCSKRFLILFLRKDISFIHLPALVLIPQFRPSASFSYVVL